MYFGELKEHSTQYQLGHEKGSDRAYDDIIGLFEALSRNFPNAKHTNTQMLALLKERKESWINFCSTYGMGVEEEN